MRSRKVTSRLTSLLRRFPAVALVGPRQAGKTTLAQSLGGRYFDLEQEDERLRLGLQWEAMCAQRSLVILDEAQSDPGVFPRLRGAIDRDRKRMGRFLLLGSVSPALMAHVSESLAGRLAVCEMAPFLLPEVPVAKLDTLWLDGGFPDGGLFRRGRYPEWQLDYLRLLAQRDLPGWGFPARPQVTNRLLRMLAAVHGTLWNASELGRSLALSYHTVGQYTDYLEGAFLTRKLPPFAGSLRKRLARSPRFYWRDSGFLHALHRVSDYSDLLRRPWVGASWEGFVIEQAIGTLTMLGVPHDASYVRTNDGYEVDLVLELGGERWAIEVKLTATPGSPDLARLNRAADLIRADRRILVSRTTSPASSGVSTSTNLSGFLTILMERA